MPALKQTQVTATLVRDADERDVLRVQESKGKLGFEAPKIRAIRDIHHRTAQLLAAGYKQEEVSAIIGISPSRISILKQDPSFKELLEFYRGKQEEIFEDQVRRLASAGKDALIELHERLMAQPEEFTNNELLTMVEKMMDRAGFGPQSVHKHEHGLSPEAVQAIKKQNGEEGRVFEQEEGQRVTRREAALPPASDAEEGEQSSPSEELSLEGLGL